MIKSFTQTLIYRAALLLIGATAVSASAAIPEAPLSQECTNFKGTSFDANWNAVDNADSYLLSVFSKNKNKAVNNFYKFESLDFPAELTINGVTELYENGDTKGIDLGQSGSVIFQNPTGLLENITLKGLATGIDGVSTDNQALLRVEFYNFAGDLLLSGEIQCSVFTAYGEFSITQLLGHALPADCAGIGISVRRRDSFTQGNIVLTQMVCSYYQSDYLLNNLEVSGTTYNVGGVDASGVYYYFVKAKNSDGVSHQSNVSIVDKIVTPAQTYDADITTTSYVAGWDYVDKADGYNLYHYLLTPLEGNEIKVLDEDFSASTQGSFDSPVSVTNPDDITAYKGWTGNNIIAAEGMMGADKGSFPRNISYLWTPELDLSANDGVYTIHIKAKGTPGNKLSLYRNNYYLDDNYTLNMHQVTFGEDGWLDETWEMTDGVESMTISIEESGLRKFMLESITISQKGGSSSIAVISDDFSGATEGTVDSPASVSNTDAITANPGWTGNNIISANGMLGANKGSFPRNISYLWTPELDLSANDGVYTIHIKAKGTPGNKLSLYRNNYYLDDNYTLNMHQVTFGEDGWLDETWEMTDGVESMTISIEESGLRMFLIDEIEISQKGEGSGYSRSLVGKYDITDPNTTAYDFTGLQPGKTYGFQVEAYHQDVIGSTVTADRTDMHIVTLLSESAIDVVEEDATIAIVDGVVKVNSANDVRLTVFDLGGRVVLDRRLSAGQSSTRLDLSAGIYIVRLGNTSFKTMVR